MLLGRPVSASLSTLLAALLLVSAGGARPQEPPAGEPPVADGPVEPASAQGERVAALPQDDWQAALERDGRLGFAPMTLRSAYQALAQSDLGPGQRAQALFALGASGGEGERGLLESWTRRGTPLERQAAILGLGELGPGSTPLLSSLAREKDPVLAGCALLALLRSGGPNAVQLVRSMAADPDGPQAALAAELVRFVEQPQASAPTAASRAYLDLRYLAAQRHGLIDGKTYRVARLETLGQDEEFLDRFVYAAAVGLRRPGVRDHFLGVVADAESALALRSAVRVLPTEVAQLVAAGLWTPDAEQWTTVLATIDELQLEGLTEPLLQKALEAEGLEGWAALLLVRAGNLRGRAIVERELMDAGPEAKRRVLEGLGASGERGFLGWLASFSEDPDEGVRAASLVAQMRLGHEGSRRTLEILLSNPGLASRQVPQEALVEALAVARGDATALTLLSAALPLLADEARVQAAAALAAAGRVDGAEVLRAELRARTPRGAVGARRVAALLRLPSEEDLQLGRELFPLEGEAEVNAELAKALLRQRDPVVHSLLRAAIWSGPFHRSVLAAGLYADALGLDALRQEIENPPRNVRAQDLRRVGFALGEWGGMLQVEVLARRAGAGDPGLQGALLGALSARTQ